MIKRIRFLLFLIIVLFSLTTDGDAAGFTKEAVEFEARYLMNRMEITRDVSFKLKNRLSMALQDGALSEAIGKHGVGAVFVYACGEGSILVRYMGGDGLISFIDGRRASPITLSSWGIGAMIGGSAQWGIGLMIGRVDENGFGGRYKGGVRSATAWGAATGALLYLSRTGEKDIEEIYIISASRGFTAGVGGVVMNLVPAW
jgi:hypothetical protein